MLEDLAGIPVDVEYASEYTYRSTHTPAQSGVVVISQSGETADTLAALREAQARGLATVAITNNAHSSMATEASASLPTFAGIGESHSCDKKLYHAISGALYTRSPPGTLPRPYDAAGSRSAWTSAKGDSRAYPDCTAGLAKTD